VREYIRFGAMSCDFLLSKVSPTGILSPSEEHSVLRSKILKNADSCPFGGMKQRKGGMFFSDCHNIERGTIDTDSSWHYNGAVDAVCIQVNHACYLYGIGILCGEGHTQATVSVYNGRDSRERIGQKSITTEHGRNDTPFTVQFDEPIALEANQVYTVELSQRNSDGPSFRMVNCRSTAMIDNGAYKITFSEAENSPNGTDENCGAFPNFYIWV